MISQEPFRQLSHFLGRYYSRYICSDCLGVVSKIYLLTPDKHPSHFMTCPVPSAEMENKIKTSIFCDDEKGISELLNAGLDPNYEGGWPIRLAARHGSCAVVRTLLQYGANPHLLGESGASTLQLAIYSGLHWTTDRWTFLVSCCDSSQLADGAAVAIVFNNIAGLKKILETGRCNTNLPTTLTGKTVEDLAKGYKLQHLLNFPTNQSINTNRNVTPVSSPRESRINRGVNANQLGTSASPHHRNLSPSVARFFHQTAGQTSLTPPRSPIYTG